MSWISTVIALALTGLSPSGCSTGAAGVGETTPAAAGGAATEPAPLEPGTEPDDSSRPPAATPESPDPGLQPLEAVSRLRGLEGWTIIPLAHFRRGTGHALIVWPAIDAAGSLVDATVVGVALEIDGEGNFVEHGQRWVVREGDASRASLATALGGDDWEVLERGVGVPLDQLGPRLSSLSVAFGRFVAAGARNDAVDAAVHFSRLLPLERAAFTPGVAQLLWMASAHSARLEHVATHREGETATLTIRVMRGGMTFRTITATASPVEGHPDRWVVTSYRE